jgi:hypothetical protein
MILLRSMRKICVGENGQMETRRSGRLMQKYKPKKQEKKRHRYYNIPESLSEFCIIVSLTAANTSRTFVVSVACVRLKKRASAKLGVLMYSKRFAYCGYTLNRARFDCINLHRMYLAALLMSDPPVYSGKYFSSGT